MKKYETILFDLDDTLLDNSESIKYAFSCVCKHLNIPYTKDLGNFWCKCDNDYWHSWYQGKITIPKNFKTTEEKVIYLRGNRFIEFFKDVNLSLEDAKMINDLYCNNLGVNIVEIEGAKKIIEYLSNKYELIIATNGAKVAASKKIKKLKIERYISKIVTSEEVGIGKPNTKFFDFVLDKTKGKDKSKIVIIGDSLTTDIKGGINYNIDTCWFNKESTENKSNCFPTFTVNKLLELKKIL